MHPVQWSAPPDPAVIRKRRRGRLLLILALLVVGLPALACYRGIEQETATTTLVTKKVGQNVGEALSSIATLPNPLEDPTAARIAVQDVVFSPSLPLPQPRVPSASAPLPSRHSRTPS